MPVMGKKDRSSAMTLSGVFPARKTLEHIPLAENAVMMGSLGQANQVATASTAIKNPHRIRRISFFFIGIEFFETMND